MAEPATSAKVVLKTTKGNLEIELWAKEVSKTSRKFIQNCLDKTYVGQEFNRISKEFLIQSDSKAVVQSKDNSDEEIERFPRLKFNRRGILGASSGCNPDSFFITYNETSQLNSKHTPFGKIVGDTHYTVVSIHDGELKEGLEFPVFPVQITDCEVIIPFFNDLVEATKEPDKAVEEIEKVDKKKKRKIKIDLNLEEDDDEYLSIRKTKIQKVERQPIISQSVQEGKGVVESTSENSSNQHEQRETEESKEIEKEEAQETIREENELDEDHEEEVSEIIENAEPKDTLIRNPEIDSEYDLYLDLSDEEKEDPKKLYTHKFISA